MGLPQKRRATYQDVLDAPERMVAEVLGGELHLSPRPAFPHARATSRLTGELMGPFDRGRGGPGGWVILVEPELHLGTEPAILVPDLAGWRRSRLPDSNLQLAFSTVAPDWICEVLSPSTEQFDRKGKLWTYGEEGVQFAWLVNPISQTLEVFRHSAFGWTLIATHAGQVPVRAEPFEALEFDLGALWGMPPPASEP